MEELIIRCLQGRASPEEEGRLWEWRRRDDYNEAHFREVERLWQLLGDAEYDRTVSEPPDPTFIVERAESEMSAGAKGSVPDIAPGGLAASRAGTASGPGAAWRVMAWSALAAGIAALGFGLGTLADAPNSPRTASLDHQVTTGAGELTTVLLPDGTAVRLGPRSTFRFSDDADGADRAVWLEGRAFFGVEPDPSRTFTVQTPYGDAVALGTRFEVRTEEEEFRVLVVQGTVRVSAARSAVELGPGVMSLSQGGAAPSTSLVDRPEELLDWMGSTLVFRATPLRFAVREIERRFPVDVALEDAELGEIELTATFTDQPVDVVATVICEILNASCEIGQDRIRIDRADESGSRASPSTDPAEAVPAA